ncbi:MAG: hypothetical protein QXI92_01215 [Candidatus Nitrosocaldus sp.]
MKERETDHSKNNNSNSNSNNNNKIEVTAKIEADLLKFRDKTIRRYGYNNYLKLLYSLIYIVENGRFNTTNFLSNQIARVWISNNLPPPHEGYLLEDLDLILLRYSKEDKIGKFKLIEIKYIDQYRLRKAQEITFNLIDSMLRVSNNNSSSSSSSSNNNRYEGFYLLRLDNMQVDNATSIYVNNEKVSREELREFLLGKRIIEPYRFDLMKYNLRLD